MKIAGRKISQRNKPYIVAELSANHNGSLQTALRCVRLVAKAGADAIKLQTYRADSITLNLRKGEFLDKDKKSLWYGRSLHSIYKKGETPWKWHSKIFKMAKKMGIHCFSSPFDFEAVDFLEKLKTPCYKIASPECVDIPLIKKTASKRKPIIISTGMASQKEIHTAIKTARKSGCKNIALLKCTSAYPAKIEDCNLDTISEMRSKFGCEVGFSDHTVGITAAVVAVSKGATIIEKHFKTSNKDRGLDSKFSIDFSELKKLVKSCNQAWLARGKIIFGPSVSEKKNLRYRRSLYIVKDLIAGNTLTSKNIRSIRPANGLDTKYYYKVLGKKIKKNIKKGTPLKFNFIK